MLVTFTKELFAAFLQKTDPRREVCLMAISRNRVFLSKKSNSPDQAFDTQFCVQCLDYFYSWAEVEARVHHQHLGKTQLDLILVLFDGSLH